MLASPTTGFGSWLTTLPAPDPLAGHTPPPSPAGRIPRRAPKPMALRCMPDNERASMKRSHSSLNRIRVTINAKSRVSVVLSSGRWAPTASVERLDGSWPAPLRSDNLRDATPGKAGVTVTRFDLLRKPHPGPRRCGRPRRDRLLAGSSDRREHAGLSGRRGGQRRLLEGNQRLGVPTAAEGFRGRGRADFTDRHWSVPGSRASRCGRSAGTPSQ